MHEVAIAEEIKEIALDKMKEHGALKITGIALIIGEMTSVVPEALTFAFESVCRGTPMEAAEIRIENVKLKARCRRCGAEFRVKDFFYICPECAGTDVEVIKGKEMIIKTIDME